MGVSYVRYALNWRRNVKDIVFILYPLYLCYVNAIMWHNFSLFELGSSFYHLRSKTCHTLDFTNTPRCQGKTQELRKKKFERNEFIFKSTITTNEGTKTKQFCLEIKFKPESIFPSPFLQGYANRERVMKKNSFQVTFVFNTRTRKRFTQFSRTRNITRRYLCLAGTRISRTSFPFIWGVDELKTYTSRLICVLVVRQRMYFNTKSRRCSVVFQKVLQTDRISLEMVLV